VEDPAHARAEGQQPFSIYTDRRHAAMRSVRAPMIAKAHPVTYPLKGFLPTREGIQVDAGGAIPIDYFSLIGRPFVGQTWCYQVMNEICRKLSLIETFVDLLVFLNILHLSQFKRGIIKSNPLSIILN
jgi:hypothetical protein